MDAHRDEVIKDFSDATMRGVEVLTVTPWRSADRSAVHNVALTKGCKELKWLKELYCAECPPGMIVQFKVKQHKPTATQPECATLKVTFVHET